MKMTCPGCGGTFSAEAWANDANIRQFIRVLSEMPTTVTFRLLQYLSMFRPHGRGLQWAKALRLAGEISDMVKKAHIQWDNKPARPIDARIWGMAMERMIASPPKRLPITSHGYLRSIAYEIADETDKGRENAENKKSYRANTPARSEAEPERVDTTEMRKWLEARKPKNL
jgi:hypothetical protein